MFIFTQIFNKKPPISRGLLSTGACVSRPSECYGLYLILSESTVAASIAVLYSDKRRAEVDKASIDNLVRGLKAKETSTGATNRIKCAI